VVELVTGPVRVRVPASSANLGPGFDALGLALTIHDEVTAEVTDEVGGVEITVTGEGADSVPRDASHLVHRSLVRGLTQMGLLADGSAVPGLRLHCDNVIPHGRGLGSSSAAIVAGLALARALVPGGAERLDDDALFAVAADIEGHPDNVAAAVYGGFTIAWTEPAGFRAVRLDVTARVVPVVLVPVEPVETKVARGLLPATVPFGDAAHNAGRSALLVAALTGGEAGALTGGGAGRGAEGVAHDLAACLVAATEDRLHEAYRAPAMPATAAVVSELRSNGHPAVVSGAGPTVLALVPAEEAAAVAAYAPQRWRALVLGVDNRGVRTL
jgi:homoserine kinase